MAAGTLDQAAARRLLTALEDLGTGTFRRRLPETGDGIALDLARAFNEVADRNSHLAAELRRVRRAVGREGKLH